MGVLDTIEKGTAIPREVAMLLLKDARGDLDAAIRGCNERLKAWRPNSKGKGATFWREAREHLCKWRNAKWDSEYKTANRRADAEEQAIATLRRLAETHPHGSQWLPIIKLIEQAELADRHLGDHDVPVGDLLEYVDDVFDAQAKALFEKGRPGEAHDLLQRAERIGDAAGLVSKP